MSCKIVFIGAGSVEFGSAIIGDLAHFASELVNAEIVLVDIDPQALTRALAYAERMFLGLPLRVRSAADRRSALPGADFVIVSVAVNRIAEWKLDWSIPLKHGVRHVRGENGGPGALRHAMRSIPLVLAIARDIEALAPKALMLNYTNPLSRVCLAVSRYTSVRCVGLSRQAGAAFQKVNNVLGLVHEPDALPESAHSVAKRAQRIQFQQALKARIYLEVSGISHFTFITRMTDLTTGEDLYPRFRQRLKNMPDHWQLLSRRLHEAFGLYCASYDEFAGEFVGWASDVLPLSGFDFDGYALRAIRLAVEMDSVANGTMPTLREFSGERAVAIIVSVVTNRVQHELGVNVVNRGHIANLPDFAIVEVPGLADRAGVRGLTGHGLPDALASLMKMQCDISSLVVNGVSLEDHKFLMQAILLDPTVKSFKQAEHLMHGG